MGSTRSVSAAMSRSTRPLRSETAATRARIVSVAERLFATRGIDAVSLREINAAAGQYNKSALQYHFRSKEGLIRAILAKHQPGMEQAGHALLDRIEASGEVNLHALAQAVASPVAEKLRDPDGGVSFIRVMAQLIGHPCYPLLDLFARTVNRSMDRQIRLTHRALPHIPESLLVLRALLITEIVVHALADYSHLVERHKHRLQLPSYELFVSNLIDNLVALYGAPVSEETRLLLRKEKRAPGQPIVRLGQSPVEGLPARARLLDRALTGKSRHGGRRRRRNG
jgi:AcrR family transcriptional regulator